MRMGCLPPIPRLTQTSLPLALDGRPPMPGETITGCAFADRCALADQRCRLTPPTLKQLDSGEKVRCFHPDRIDQLPVVNEYGGKAKR